MQETDDPSHEANLGGYASERPGLMHACGHDGHTAVGLAVAEWVKEHADELCGRFKFIFQPAEEGTRGAEPLAESGVADDIDYLVAEQGITLGYGRYSGDNTTYNNLRPGARVIVLSEGVRGFETWIREDDGRIVDHVRFEGGKIVKYKQ